MVIISNPITGTIDNFLDIALGIVSIMMIYYFIRFFMVSPPSEEERKKSREEEEERQQKTKDWVGEKFKKAQERKKKEEDEHKEKVNKERRENHIKYPLAELIKINQLTEDLPKEFERVTKDHSKSGKKKREAALETTTKDLDQIEHHLMNANKALHNLKGTSNLFDRLWAHTGNPLRLVEYLKVEVKDYANKGYHVSGTPKTEDEILIDKLKKESKEIQKETATIIQELQKYLKEGTPA